MAYFNTIACVLLCISSALCSERCGEIFETGVPDGDIETAVNVHNDLRGRISRGEVPGQPKSAQPLADLQWDYALAIEAQKIAETCVFEHVSVSDDRFYVGQNLAGWGGTGKTMGADWKSMIEMWFNEYKNFIYPNQSTGTVGHYTQVVWENTKYVGCGYVMYRETGSIWYSKFYVCNYGPGGNYVGEAPYKV